MSEGEFKKLIEMFEATSLNQIVCGDAFEVLKGFPEESVDLVVTDPPYGYSFMGKDWDKAVPSIDIWKECLRVLKSGTFAFVMSSPRQDVLSQMIVRIGQAGFETGFTSIYWTYASGFPKAMNVGKAVDKKLGVKREIISGESKPHEYSGKFDQRSSKDRPKDNGAISEQAKSLNGSYGGFQPKPAVEVIIVCMKPLSEKTFVDQALANGKGVTWLDDGRIPITSNDDLEDYEFNRRGFHERADLKCRPYEGGWKPRTICLGEPKGRFPANLLVSDDALNDGNTSKGIRSQRGGNVSSGEGRYQWNEGEKENFDKDSTYECGYNDSGSFSRYFDLDKWFSKQIENLPEQVKKVFPFLICPKASKTERNQGCSDLQNETYLDESRLDKDAIGCNNPRNRSGTIRKGNMHPTVKPLKLMSYLVTLGSRKGDVVLDPFCGSGTTCLASEMLNRKWIGIDINPEYCGIARKRLTTIPKKLDGFMKFPENEAIDMVLKMSKKVLK